MERQEEPQPVRMYETSGGTRIFQIPLLVFPGMWGYAYLVLVEAGRSRWKALIDTGSGFGCPTSTWRQVSRRFPG